MIVAPLITFHRSSRITILRWTAWAVASNRQRNALAHALSEEIRVKDHRVVAVSYNPALPVPRPRSSRTVSI